MTRSALVSACASATIAPTTTMPWTKFDPDIRGVCRITGTLEMISWPVKAANTTMYNAMNPSIPFPCRPLAPCRPS